MTGDDTGEIARWWADCHARDYAGVQSCEGFDWHRDEEGGYTYVWLTAYVDGDMSQHYLLDVRTKTEGDDWETRDFVAVSTTPDGDGGPARLVWAKFGRPVGFTAPTAEHRAKFREAMAWFAAHIDTTFDDSG